MPTTLVVKNAEKAYAYSEMPFSSSAAIGIAVPTAVASNAMRRTTETMPRVSGRCAAPSTDSRRGAAGSFASEGSSVARMYTKVSAVPDGRHLPRSRRPLGRRS
ncbi:hypothetical protein STAL104432_31500 [Streptomyces albus]